MGITICRTQWLDNNNGTFTIGFENCLTNQHEYRTYTSKASARAAITKFQNRMNRIYTESAIKRLYGITD